MNDARPDPTDHAFGAAESGSQWRNQPVTGAGRPSLREDSKRTADLLHLLIDTVQDYAIFMLDPTGHVVSWNPGAERFKGYQAAEIIGKHFSVFYTPEDIALGKPALLLEAAARDRRVESEGWRVRKDGRRFWADVVLTALRDPEGRLVGFGKVTRDLTERKEAEDQRLKLAHERQDRDAAERAVRLRDEFLSIAAHELKTPVTSLRLQAQMLIRLVSRPEEVDQEKLRRGLGLVEDQSQKIGILVNKLLDVSRVTNGRLALDPVETDVAVLLRLLVEATRTVIDTHSILLEAPEELFARVDPLRIEQVVVNLLDNAVKFSPPGPIAVDLSRRAPGLVVIGVRDHGPGIAPDQRERIFDRFFQADRVTYDSGMGLGLYISQQIARLHGGEVRAESPSDGGTRIVVTLPIGDVTTRV